MLVQAQGSMNFSQALIELKKGYNVFREGWNGKGTYIFLNPGFFIDDEKQTNLAYIEMKTAQGFFVPWVASHSDLLADDWFILEPMPL